MRVKNAGVLGVQRLADLGLHFDDLLPGQHQGLVQPLDLLRQFRLRDIIFGDGDLTLFRTKIFPWAIPAETGMPLYTTLCALPRTCHEK